MHASFFTILTPSGRHVPRKVALAHFGWVLMRAASMRTQMVCPGFRTRFRALPKGGRGPDIPELISQAQTKLDWTTHGNRAKFPSTRDLKGPSTQHPRNPRFARAISQISASRRTTTLNLLQYIAAVTVENTLTRSKFRSRT